MYLLRYYGLILNVEKCCHQRIHFHSRQVVKWSELHPRWPESHRDTIQRGMNSSKEECIKFGLMRNRDQTPHTQYRLRIATWCLSVPSNRLKNLGEFPNVKYLSILRWPMSVSGPELRWQKLTPWLSNSASSLNTLWMVLSITRVIRTVQYPSRPWEPT